MSTEETFSGHVSGRKIWSKRGDMDSDYTYCSSAMSSRVRVSSREWISALERTVRGMLATCSEHLKC